MQIIKLDLDHWNFFCPVTGAQILSEESKHPVPPSLKGLWISEIWDEPMLHDAKLQEAWEILYKSLDEEENDAECVEKFLTYYVHPQYIAFQLNCGTAFHSDSSWVIIDMNQCT